MWSFWRAAVLEARGLKVLKFAWIPGDIRDHYGLQILKYPQLFRVRPWPTKESRSKGNSKHASSCNQQAWEENVAEPHYFESQSEHSSQQTWTVHLNLHSDMLRNKQKKQKHPWTPQPTKKRKDDLQKSFNIGPHSHHLYHMEGYQRHEGEDAEAHCQRHLGVRILKKFTLKTKSDSSSIFQSHCLFIMNHDFPKILTRITVDLWWVTWSTFVLDSFQEEILLRGNTPNPPRPATTWCPVQRLLQILQQSQLGSSEGEDVEDEVKGGGLEEAEAILAATWLDVLADFLG